MMMMIMMTRMMLSHLQNLWQQSTMLYNEDADDSDAVNV